MNAYDKRVAENLAAMNAPAPEWTSVATIGTELASADGAERPMPVFAFPEGYTEAPSLYRHSRSSCCNLCGEDIKNVFWIQNDSKKWVMPVGSECVTHFGAGLSGEKIHRQGEQARHRALLSDLCQARSSIWKTFATVQQLGYGRTERSISHRTALGGEALALRSRIVKLIGSNDPKESNDGAITRWAGKNAAAALGLMSESQELFAKRERREMEAADRKAARSTSLSKGLAP